MILLYKACSARPYVQTSLDFFPNPDFYGFLKTSTPILIRVYF
ncbi:hypothetical protein [Moraxella lacunata]